MSTFHPFPRLPTEIQLLIWELSTEEPREVDLRLSHVSSGVGGEMEFLPWATRQPPAVLQACRTARTQLQGAGRYIRVPVERRDSRPPLRVPYVWVDPDKDTVRVSQCCVARLGGSPYAPRLRHLAVDIIDWCHFWCCEGRDRSGPWEGLLRGDLPCLQQLDLFVCGTWFFHPWRRRVRRLMETLYATCSPAALDVRVRFLVSDRPDALTRDNYGRLFLEEDIAEWVLYNKWFHNVPEPVAYIPKWTHNDCSCPKGVNPGIYVRKLLVIDPGEALFMGEQGNNGAWDSMLVNTIEADSMLVNTIEADSMLVNTIEADSKLVNTIEAEE